VPSGSARFRLHLVKHRSSLKNRVHSILFQHGVPNPGSDLFGAGGRRLLARLRLPEPWASTMRASLALIDALDEQITACEQELRTLGADHRYIPLLTTCPGIAWILGFTIASEIGDIARFPTPRKLVGYSGLCPKVEQSGERDRRGRRGRPHRRPPPVFTDRSSNGCALATAEAWQQDRRDRDRPPPNRGDLAHAQPQPPLCSGRRHDPLGRLTAPKGIALPEQLQPNSSPLDGCHREMSRARTVPPTKEKQTTIAT